MAQLIVLTVTVCERFLSMAGKFELKKATNDEFYFSLKAGNGEIILMSERYTTRAAATNGIESVKKNSPLDDRYDKRTAKNAKPYFVLKAANGQIIGQSELYESERSRDNGIESVKKNGPDAPVKDLTTAS